MFQRGGGESGRYGEGGVPEKPKLIFKGELGEGGGIRRDGGIGATKKGIGEAKITKTKKGKAGEGGESTIFC